MHSADFVLNFVRQLIYILLVLYSTFLIYLVPTEPPTTRPETTIEIEAKVYMNNEDRLPSKELSEESSKNMNGAGHVTNNSMVILSLVAICIGFFRVV